MRTVVGSFTGAMKIALGLIILLVLSATVVFGKIKYEQNRMNPLTTGEVIPGIYAISNSTFVNIFLVQSGNEFLMIDAGDNAQQTQSALEELAIPADAIKAILLTHSDSDHVASLSMFPEAQLYLPEMETQMIDGRTRRTPIGNNSWNETTYPLLVGKS